MIPDLSILQIYVRPGVTDMRKQVNGLSIITEEEMELAPGSGSLFLFCSRDRKLIKCIYWDRNGFCLWQKRLEKGKYPWPYTEVQAREISQEQLKMLLDGIDFWHAHQRLSYEEIA
ncbi:IS66 family insertion sequence element accessory protein TnpB [Sediminispirochaeta bajacaliforniensis]|uniref:IS66 family insertion sequence element accessory protein TnpB n=1 Tax=Sediminispirochaeta bajacaliforniensis TaxID=148 RepID=UPI000381C9B0|nr:IS66 family insertion sequence element accessory protein TnpB [Sediminispirochaeta bajacaliforniensis]